MREYFRLWFKLTINTSQVALASRLGAVIFSFGKILRFFYFLFFLLLLFSKVHAIGGYSVWQMIFFFLSFNFIDSLSQFLWRAVYRFRSYVVHGYFDYLLLMPKSALFRALFEGSDILDLPILFISVILLFFAGIHLSVHITFVSLLLYILLLINSLTIALAFHIFVLSMGVLTTEVDNTIMLYRDLTQAGRVPIDIYKDPIRSLLTFAVPVGIMMTFPVKVLIGLLSPLALVSAFSVGAVFLFLSLSFWKYALRHYQSASS